MATTQAAATEGTLQDLAKRHLWMHFSRMGAYNDGAEIPIIVKGDGGKNSVRRYHKCVSRRRAPVSPSSPVRRSCRR